MNPRPNMNLLMDIFFLLVMGVLTDDKDGKTRTCRRIMLAIGAEVERAGIPSGLSGLRGREARSRMPPHREEIAP